MQHLYAYYLHQKLGSQSLKNEQKKVVDLYQEHITQMQKNIYAILDLLVKWEKAAITDDQENKTPFKSQLPNSPFITLIKKSQFYQEFSRRFPGIWEQETAELIYYQSIKPKRIFLKKKLTTDSEEDRELIDNLVKKVFFKEKTIQVEMEMQDRNWIENKVIAKFLFFSFAAKCGENSSEAFSLLLPEPNSENEKLFTVLLEKTKAEHDNYIQWIESNTHNWEVSRITPLDQVLLQMVLTEILYLPEINPSISINEYLEIAKKYSTPKSHSFIHGIVDCFIKDASETWNKV